MSARTAPRLRSAGREPQARRPRNGPGDDRRNPAASPPPDGAGCTEPRGACRAVENEPRAREGADVPPPALRLNRDAIREMVEFTRHHPDPCRARPTGALQAASRRRWALVLLGAQCSWKASRSLRGVRQVGHGRRAVRSSSTRRDLPRTLQRGAAGSGGTEPEDVTSPAERRTISHARCSPVSALAVAVVERCSRSSSSSRIFVIEGFMPHIDGLDAPILLSPPSYYRHGGDTAGLGSTSSMSGDVVGGNCGAIAALGCGRRLPTCHRAA